MVLANDATLDGDLQTGDPTEVALLAFADTARINRNDITSKTSRVGGFPFDSDRKMMSTMIAHDQEYTVYTKGAIDSLLKVSTHYLHGEAVIPLGEEEKKRILEVVEAMSLQSLRTL